MKKAIPIILITLLLTALPAFAAEKYDAITSASPATAKKPRPVKKTKSEILDWLKSHRRVSIATVAPKGYPYVSGVFYVNEGHTIYFRARKTTQKIINIQHENRVAYTIWTPGDMSKHKAIQMIGYAKILQGKERHRVAKMFKGPKVTDKYAVVAIYPKLCLWTDNTIKFGYSELVKYDYPTKKTKDKKSGLCP